MSASSFLSVLDRLGLPPLSSSSSASASDELEWLMEDPQMAPLCAWISSSLRASKHTLSEEELRAYESAAARSSFMGVLPAGEVLEQRLRAVRAAAQQQQQEGTVVASSVAAIGGGGGGESVQDVSADTRTLQHEASVVLEREYRRAVHHRNRLQTALTAAKYNNHGGEDSSGDAAAAASTSARIMEQKKEQHQQQQLSKKKRPGRALEDGGISVLTHFSVVSFVPSFCTYLPWIPL